MIQLHFFTFNPFQENTYVLWDETKECIIIDPGCYNEHEQDELKSFIEDSGLKPVKIVNTHCHIDHVFGIAFCKRTWDIPFVHHALDVPVLQAASSSALMFGVQYEMSPPADEFISEKDILTFGESEMEVRFTPGHSPGSVCFIADQEDFVIGGDVLFQLSIGRTDLPGGDHQTLLDSIRAQLFTLPDYYIVYPGHGPATEIGFEKERNPYLQG
ncbi:MAG: MBL fold metallo-hydrolase [Bacteroidetes bacterium]|nr:MBL fold metallo-hydrolase [Bacteroidota bacterium]